MSQIIYNYKNDRNNFTIENIVKFDGLLINLGQFDWIHVNVRANKLILNLLLFNLYTLQSKVII